MTQPAHDATGESIEPGEVYKIHGRDERPLNIYAESTQEKGRFEWYRIPSWPVAFLGFEEFDIRVHRALEGYGWTLTEASTGMRILLDSDAKTSDGPCVTAGFMIAQGKLTTEKIKEGIAKAEEKLKAVRESVSARSETPMLHSATNARTDPHVAPLCIPSASTYTPSAGTVHSMTGDCPTCGSSVHDEIHEDAERHRWFRDECDQDRRIEILEASEGIADLIDHHIDKGRVGL